MNSPDIPHWLQGSTLGHALRSADPMVGAASQVVHVFGFVLLLAAVLLGNLRLAGAGMRASALPDVARSASRLLWWGLAFAVASGLPMLLSDAVRYAANPAVWAKAALLLAALAVQLTLWRAVTRQAAPSPSLARTTAALSLALWFGVALCGRAIGFI